MIKYGLLEVVSEAGRSARHRDVNVRCECGLVFVVRFDHLRTGRTTSCGSCGRKRHGLTGTATHRVWSGMRDRCNNPNHMAYARYGGRGVAVCERWSVFENFLADMGPRPDGMSLDRINNNGNYEPGNCRWATRHEQARNTRRSRKNGIELAMRAVAMWKAGASVAAIASAIGVGNGFVSHVLHGKSYADVTGIKRHSNRLQGSAFEKTGEARPDYDTWIDTVDAAMVRLRMSQKELASRAGIGQGTVSSILSGRIKHSSHRDKISKVLGL